MGVDLKLMPLQPGESEVLFPYCAIPLDSRNYILHCRLRELSIRLDSAVYVYKDHGIERCHVDQYGDPLSYVTAGQFVKVWDNMEQTDSNWNHAVRTFIGKLNNDHKIVLWFH